MRDAGSEKRRISRRQNLSLRMNKLDTINYNRGMVLWQQPKTAHCTSSLFEFVDPGIFLGEPLGWSSTSITKLSSVVHGDVLLNVWSGADDIEHVFN